MESLTCPPDVASLAGLSVKEAMEAFKDITYLLDDAGIEHVVAGGIALRAYEETRYTKDLDLWL
ncbi:MAG: hypothetical protein QMD08_08040, partial [Actinomycetota bacterium]|nr:hypothetical protein [Actinomycetota bacterium]